MTTVRPWTIRRCRMILWWSGGIVLCLALAGVLATSEQASVADWRVGKLQYVDRGEQGIKLYMSLRNLGKPSRERVSLYVLAGANRAPSRRDRPVIDLTRTTRNKLTAVVETTFALPPIIAERSPKAYCIVLTVEGTTTDFVPVIDGEAVLNARERKEFHK